jgi:hypothetical protein
MVPQIYGYCTWRAGAYIVPVVDNRFFFSRAQLACAEVKGNGISQKICSYLKTYPIKPDFIAQAYLHLSYR